MPLINIAWDKSFASVEENKTIIAERGWNPLNYNLLTNLGLRATMTVAERNTESSKVTLPPSFMNTGVGSSSNGTSTNSSQSDSELPSSISNYNNHNENSSISNSIQQLSLYFSPGVSGKCLAALI